MITVVCGLPGSGKGEFVNSVAQAYELAYQHESWMEDQYKAECVRNDITMLFGGALKFNSPTDDDFKGAVNSVLERFPALNQVLMNYFDAKYACLIAALAPSAAQNIIECPFIDANIAAIKEAYPGHVRVLWMETPDDIEERLAKKSWSQKRITRTIGIKTTLYNRYKELIDEYVKSIQ